MATLSGFWDHPIGPEGSLPFCNTKPWVDANQGSNADRDTLSAQVPWYWPLESPSLSAPRSVVALKQLSNPSPGSLKLLGHKCPVEAYATHITFYLRGFWAIYRRLMHLGGAAGGTCFRARGTRRRGAVGASVEADCLCPPDHTPSHKCVCTWDAPLLSHFVRISPARSTSESSPSLVGAHDAWPPLHKEGGEGVDHAMGQDGWRPRSVTTFRSCPSAPRALRFGLELKGSTP